MTDSPGPWGAWQVEASPFTKSVVEAMQKLYGLTPILLAGH